MTGNPDQTGFDMRIALLFDGAMTDVNQVDTDVSALIEYGVSNQLVSLLAAIEEATLIDGSPRYRQQAIYELRRKLLCYNYSAPYYEVAHLLAIATHYGSGIDDLFWLEEAVTGDRLKSISEPWQGDSLTCTNQLNLNLPDRTFTFNWKRTNVIAAWSEFLLFILKPGLHVLLEPFTTSISGKAIDQLAREFQQQTYAFLKDHLQPQNQLRECWQFLKWLRDDDTATDYRSAITDARVIEFWCENSTQDTGDYRRFVSVGELAFNVIRSIESGSQRWQLDHAASHSMTNDEGDAWIDRMGDAVFAPDDVDTEQFNLCDIEMDEPMMPTEILTGDLSAIKFLTATDLAQAKLLERPAVALKQLPFTHVRMHLFGKQQAAITGDLQNQQGKNLASLISCEGITDPLDWQADLTTLAHKINDTQAAVAHMLISQEQPAGIAALMQSNAELETNITPGDASFDGLLAQVETIAPELLQHCANQYKKNNRQGFKEQPASDQLPDYITGHQQLGRLAQSYHQLSAIIDNYKTIFDSDRSIFCQQFHCLYEARL